MENSDFIALASAVVAFSAFVVTIWQGWLTRRHNILSVKPILQISENYSDGLFVYFQNTGLGPAIIEKINIQYDDLGFENPTSNPYIEIFNLYGLTGYEYKYHMPTINASYTPADPPKVLLSLEPENLSQNYKVELKDFYKKLKYEIHYKSIYAEEIFICYNGSSTLQIK